jgi:hypothetical protein
MDRDTITVGQHFRERQPPRRLWRVDEKQGGCYRLVCADRPKVVRFPPADVLLDQLRYVRAETQAGRESGRSDLAPR